MECVSIDFLKHNAQNALRIGEREKRKRRERKS